MNDFKWILYVSLRYFKTKRKNKNLSTGFFSVAGIAVGVIAMISVLGVMNGFQLGFINKILEINSFHIRAYGKTPVIDTSFVTKVRKNKHIKSILPFKDFQTLGRGISDFRACKIRAVPVSAPKLDPDLITNLGITEGSFDISRPRSIVLGSVYALSIGVHVGDTLTLISMSGNSFRTLAPVQKTFIVTGIFKSGYYEYDSSLGFISLKSSLEISSGNEPIIYGIKLNNRYGDKQVLSEVQYFTDSLNRLVSWRTYNRSFFGALRIEKIAMILLIGLIFFVVAVNIKNSLERSVYKRKDDIAILRSLGASPGKVKTIFIFEGVLIGFSGGAIGVILGLAVAVNVNELFAVFSLISSFIISILDAFFTPFLSSSGYSGRLFSPAYFYIQKVPVIILFHEVLYIFFFAFLSSILAAWSASKKITEFNPTEILRYE